MIIRKIRKNGKEKNFYVDINLEFFSGEKTEKATPKRKEKARSEGQVAISKEIATVITLIVGFLSIRGLSTFMYEEISKVINHNFTLAGNINGIINDKYLYDFLIYMIIRTLVISLPMLLIAMIVGIITNILQVGWHPTGKPLMPKLDAFNPVNGLKKLFSFKQVIETVISILKIIFITFIIYSTVKDEVYIIRNIMYMDLFQGVIYVGNLCIDVGLKVGYFFIIIAILDFAYQKYSLSKKLRMSKQDLKDEYKQAEGDPLIKSQIRQKMREAALKRMMQDIPSADVVITNPTHFAVVIKYDRQKEGAPTIVAKGTDHLARKIKEIAKENNVEIVENKPLARALYKTTDIGKEIPADLYQSVAEVLAFVYKLKNMV